MGGKLPCEPGAAACHASAGTLGDTVVSKSIILIDFDNIFGGLWALDRDLAVRFASEPKVWLESLTERYVIEHRRRWLVARCYLNPAGSVFSEHETSGRLFFSRFRPLWVGAGFEVVDTPTLARNKNAADIRMVIDALDMIQHPAGYDEFLIASGDSDFTPLLHRLRACDRLITVMSPGNAVSAYTSLADKILDFDAIAALLRPDIPDSIVAAQISEQIPVDAINPALQLAFSEFIIGQYAEATGPLNIAALAQQAARAVPGARETNWLGAETFSAAVERLSLPHVRRSDIYLWDGERHQEPVSAESFLTSDLPEALELLARTVDMPRLRSEAWPAVFAKLAEYAQTHEFNFTDSTKWTRDSLAIDNIQVGRAALGYVVRGAQLGGAPLNNDPSPSTEDIANAFLTTLINQAYSAGVNIDSQDEQIIAGWLGLDAPEEAEVNSQA